MAITLTETCVFNVIDYLTTNLPAQITAVNAARTGSNILPGASDVVLAPIKTYFDVEIPEIGEQYTPCVVVIGDTIEGVEDNPSAFEANYSISIIAAATDTNRLNIRRRMMRYAQALFLTIRQAQQVGNLGGGFPFWQTPLATYSPVYQRTAMDLYLQTVELMIALRFQEFP